MNFRSGLIGWRFRQVNDYAFAQGFNGGFPNFHQADYGQGLVYGTVFLHAGFAQWPDVLAAALGNPPEDDVGARFRATHDYAVQNGFVGGFPNFHRADYGQGVVHGTILLAANAIEVRDVPASDLGNPPEDDIEARFRATFDYAVRIGFAGGFPNFHRADYGHGVVHGTILCRPQGAESRDTLASVFGPPPQPSRLCLSIHASDLGVCVLDDGHQLPHLCSKGHAFIV